MSRTVFALTALLPLAAQAFDGRFLVARDLTREQRVIEISIPATKSVRFKPGKDVQKLELFVDDLAVRDGDVFVLTADPETTPVVRVWLLDADDGREVSGTFRDLATGADGRFADVDGGAYLDLPVVAACEDAVALRFDAHAGDLAAGAQLVVTGAGCAP